MKRHAWLTMALLAGAISLPGCGNSAHPSKEARGAATFAAPASSETEETPAHTANSQATNASLRKEEGHPFWNVMGATLGFLAAVLVVALMAGGF